MMRALRSRGETEAPRMRVRSSGGRLSRASISEKWIASEGVRVESVGVCSVKTQDALWKLKAVKINKRL